MQRASETESCWSDEEELQFPFCEELQERAGCVRVPSFSSRRPDNPVAAYLAAQGSQSSDVAGSCESRGLPPRRKRKVSSAGSFGNIASARRFCAENAFAGQHGLDSSPFHHIVDSEECSPGSEYSPASSYGASPQFHFHPDFGLRLRPPSSSSIIAIEARRPQQQPEESRLDACSPLRQQLMNMQLATR